MGTKRTLYEPKRAAELLRTDPDNSVAARELLGRERRKPPTEAEIEELRSIYARKWMSFSRLLAVERKTGKRFKRGRFSQHERKVIHAALNEFLETRGLTMEEFVNDFFLKKRSSAEVHQDSRFASLFNFVTQKLDGRPVLSVYLNMRRIYNPGNYLGRWSEEDDAELMRLYDLQGPAWQTIGIHLGRFGFSCRDRFKHLCNAGLKGPWSDEECRRLCDAVEKVRAANDGRPCWMLVSKMVGTRSPSQCIVKWSFLEMKINNPDGRRIWTPELDYNFVCRLYDLAVDHESEIVWREVAAEPDWPSFVNSMALRERFGWLKKRVRNAANMDLECILETLMLNLRPPPVEPTEASDQNQGPAKL